MGIIKKNKKGVSLAELLAAIAIIGVASSSITSMVITSYKGQLRATEYVLANEIAKTYDSVLAREIKKEKLSDITWPDSSDKTYVVVGGFDATVTGGLNDGTKLNTITGGSYGTIYKYLYGNPNDPNDTNCYFKLNDKQFDKNNVKIEIYMISPTFGYYKTRVTVKYSTDREVTIDGTHFSDLS